MSSTMSGHTSLRSSRGVHDSGCDRATARRVGLCAVTVSGAVPSSAMAIDSGAVHVNAPAPNGGGGGGSVTLVAGPSRIDVVVVGGSVGVVSGGGGGAVASGGVATRSMPVV